MSAALLWIIVSVVTSTIWIQHVRCDEQVLNCGSNWGTCDCPPPEYNTADNVLYIVKCKAKDNADLRLTSSVLQAVDPPIGSKLNVIVEGGRTLGIDATFLEAWLQYGYANLIIKNIETVVFSEVKPLPYLADPFHIYAGVELVKVRVEKLPAGLFQGAARASLQIYDSYIANLAQGLFREVGRLGSLKVVSSHIGGVSGPLSDKPIILGGLDDLSDTITVKDSVVGVVAGGALNLVAQQPQLFLMDNVTLGTLQESAIQLDGQVNLALKGCKVKHLVSMAFKMFGRAGLNLTDSEVQTEPNALSNLTCSSVLNMDNNKFYSVAQQDAHTGISMSKASLDELVSSIKSMHQQKILSNSVIIDPSCHTVLEGPAPLPLARTSSSTLLTLFILSLLCNLLVLVMVALKVVSKRTVYGRLNDKIIQLDPVTGNETTEDDYATYDNAEYDQKGFSYSTLM